MASHFRIRRWLPQVRELFLIVFAGQRGCLFPHLRVSYCWIKECRTSLSPATQNMTNPKRITPSFDTTAEDLPFVAKV